MSKKWFQKLTLFCHVLSMPKKKDMQNEAEYMLENKNDLIYILEQYDSIPAYGTLYK